MSFNSKPIIPQKPPKIYDSDDNQKESVVEKKASPYQLFSEADGRNAEINNKETQEKYILR